MESIRSRRGKRRNNNNISRNTGVYDHENKGTGTKYGQGNMNKYGNEVTYKWNATANKVDSTWSNGQTGSVTDSNYGTYGFNWYDEQAKGWRTSKQNIGTAQDIVKLKSSSYWYYPYSLTTESSTTGERKGLSIDSEEYKTLFMDKEEKEINYWLVSFGIDAGSVYTYFDIFYVSADSYVNFFSLYNSYGHPYSISLGIRPVVNLKSNVQLEWNEEKGYYDIMWFIKVWHEFEL